MATRRSVNLRIAVVALVISWLAGIVVQITDHDLLPPTISFSQYGVGGWGWLLTVFAAATAVAGVACWRALQVRNRLAAAGMYAGAAGIVVMGIVRTDAGGAQHSWHAKVHLVAAVIGMVAMPLALWWSTRRLGRGFWWTASALILVSAIALVLLLLAAAGVDSAGLGPTRSWAFWQAVAVVVDEVLITSLVVAIWQHPRRSSDRVETNAFTSV